ncbi:MAG: hypothetical protein K2J00_04985 [Bacteroidaceae bacterium]|nr:hypothetical protein [Bacteroidaceae bacterium]
MASAPVKYVPYGAGFLSGGGKFVGQMLPLLVEEGDVSVMALHGVAGSDHLVSVPAEEGGGEDG